MYAIRSYANNAIGVVDAVERNVLVRLVDVLPVDLEILLGLLTRLARERSLGHLLEHGAQFVITSYSIHYTKLYEERRRELLKLVTDDWVWRLPHVINRAHLWFQAGDVRGEEELERLLLSYNFV